MLAGACQIPVYSLSTYTIQPSLRLPLVVLKKKPDFF